MSNDRRRSLRKDLNYPAFVVVGTERYRCMVADISAGGAHVKIGITGELPPEVLLCLSISGPPCRKGRVIWRTRDSIGLQWTGRVSKASCQEHGCPFECRSPAVSRVIIDDTQGGELTGATFSG